MTNLDIQKAYLGLDEVDKVYLGSEQVYPTGPTGYASMYLTAEILSGGVLTISNSGVSYSVNDGPWTQVPSTTSTGSSRTYKLSVNSGDKIRFKGNQAGAYAFYYNESRVNQLSALCFYDIYGNILSLEYGDNFEGQTGFLTTYRPVYSAFRLGGLPSAKLSDKGIRSAEHLVLPPTVVEACYRSCFHGNINMVTAPELPAKVPAADCYNYMFGECFSLTATPVVQLESLASASCYQMFRYDSGLTEITCLAQSGINQDNSTYAWISGVAANGTFYKHPNATWPSGNNGIPTGWTVQDYVAPNP